MPGFLRKIAPFWIAFLVVNAHAEHTSAQRVMLIGLDGATWNVLSPLIREGRAPNIKRCLERGASGEIATIPHFSSPALWTTVATGRSPKNHGILGFVRDRTPESYTSRNREAPALWNILTAAQKTVLIINYFGTFPAEKVNGAIISKEFFLADSTGSFRTGAAFPVQLGERVRREMTAPDLNDPRFMAMISRELSFDWGAGVTPSTETDLAGQIDRRAWDLKYFQVGDENGLRAAELLLRDRLPDFFAIHLWGTDSAQHLFGIFSPFDPRSPHLAMRAFDHVVERYYEYADDAIGRLTKFADQDTDIVILSDHGQSPDDPAKVPSMAAALTKPFWQHNHAEPGIFIACGPGIRAASTPRHAGLLDVAPTVLALDGLPVPRDMEGRVLDEILTLPPSHPSELRPPDFIVTNKSLTAPKGRTLSPAEIDNLRKMGYLAPRH